MSIKVAQLKSGENIIADVKEGLYEEKIVCYIFDNPYSISISGTYKVLEDDELEEVSKDRHSISLRKWPLISKDLKIEIAPDWILTFFDPIDQVKHLYENQLKVVGNQENEYGDYDDECEDDNDDEQSDISLTD